MIINYLNLTNGLESLSDPNLQNIQFIRIQSTICEAKHWERLIQELDNNFLMNIAIGNKCVIHDYSANKPVPRSLYQGLEIIKYVLYRRWFKFDNYQIIIKGHKVGMEYYNTSYKRVFSNNKSLKKKIDYFKKFLLINNLENSFDVVTGGTNNDGNNEFYLKLIQDNIGKIK